MSERIQTELVKIANEIEACGGVTDEIRDKLRRLLANASLLIALGPIGIFTRNNGEDSRVMPDDLDYEAYKDLILTDGFASVFDNEGWGSATVGIEHTDFKGASVPALRVQWENKVAFVKDFHNKEAFPKQVEHYFASIELLMAPKWIEWLVELE